MPKADVHVVEVVVALEAADGGAGVVVVVAVVACVGAEHLAFRRSLAHLLVGFSFSAQHERSFAAKEDLRQVSASWLCRSLHSTIVGLNPERRSGSL